VFQHISYARADPRAAVWCQFDRGPHARQALPQPRAVEPALALAVQLGAVHSQRGLVLALGGAEQLALIAPARFAAPPTSRTSTLPKRGANSCARGRADQLAQKLREATERFTRRVAAHEAELEEHNFKLADVKAARSANRRAEKELLVKELSSATTIGIFEAEAVRVQKENETNRASYSALNMQTGGTRSGGRPNDGHPRV
jgi:hypothetical protein